MIWWPVAFLLVLAVALGWWLAGRGRSSAASRSDFSITTRPAVTRPMTPVERQAPSEEDNGPETVLSYLHFQDNNAAASDHPTGPPSDFGADDVEGQRIELALQALQEGAADRAWASLKEANPDDAHRRAFLDALERIGGAFEREQRFDLARQVYEHIADIDPQWRDVKLRLMRARGLAQNAALNNWGTVPAKPVPQVAQRTLGKYLVDREIGRGAMGAVYLGYDPATDRRVALKTMSLAQEFSGADLIDARARFLREAEMAGRLDHPDIVATLDAGEADGLAFIAMELVEGTELSEFTTRDRLLPVQTVLAIGARVADALAYAHSRGVTHRDIKPANVMVDLRLGTVKVMDFGVARVADAARTRTGVVLGTPTFMSPEQLSGQLIDGRSDLYSLGVALFQLLTGELPYRNDSMAQLMRAIAQDDVPSVCQIRPGLPPALGDVIAVTLQKHASMRYGDGQQMAEDLRAVLSMVAATQNVDLDVA
jgi:serine/threonine-protein kinase